MNSAKYLNAALTVVAVLLLGILFVQLRTQGSKIPIEFIQPAFAQTDQSSGGIVFYPVGNQDLRKMVFYDKQNGLIYIYGGGGDLDETWVVGKMGQSLKKK